MDISRECHLNFDQLLCTPSSPLSNRWDIHAPPPSLDAQDRPFNPSIHNQKASPTKNPPFHPPSTSIPCLASSAHARALPKTPSCRYRHAPDRDQDPYQRGKGKGEGRVMMCVKLIVSPTPPSIRCLARSLPMLPAVGCRPATRSRSPVSEADWESCHVCLYKHATRRLLVVWGRNARVGDFGSGVFAGLLPRKEGLRSRTRAGRRCQRLIDESCSSLANNPILIGRGSVYQADRTGPVFGAAG